MRSKTVRENLGLDGKAKIVKYPNGVFEYDKTPVIAIEISTVGAIQILLTSKRARELFQAGIQMCNELEKDRR